MGEQTLSMASSPQMDNSYLMEKKFEFMIESSNKKLVNELNALKGTIISLNSEIADIRKQVNNIQQRPASAAPVYESHNTSSQEDTPKARSNGAMEIKTAETRNNGGAIKPRFGDYTPEDVPVEKFFYFGNKSKR